MSDPALEREVLGLFVSQSGNIMAALRALPRDTAALAHTLKGSARAIGAFGAADAAGRVEDAARSGSDIRTPAVRDAVAELSSEIDLACAAIAKLLAATWDVPKTRLRLTAGATDRRKIFVLEGDPAALAARLKGWLTQWTERQ